MPLLRRKLEQIQIPSAIRKSDRVVTISFSTAKALEQEYVSQRISNRTRDGKPHPAIGSGIERQQVAVEDQVQEHQKDESKNRAHAVDDDGANLLCGFGEENGCASPDKRGSQGRKFADEVQ